MAKIRNGTCSIFQKHDCLGLKKFSVELERSTGHNAEWLQEVKNELINVTGYIQTLINKENKHG